MRTALAAGRLRDGYNVCNAPDVENSVLSLYHITTDYLIYFAAHPKKCAPPWQPAGCATATIYAALRVSISTPPLRWPCVHAHVCMSWAC